MFKYLLTKEVLLVYAITGSPQDIANLVLFLASDESLFITGRVIFCEGGMKM
jgi:NAD(P)-dependent dehydrogenase (short-subunit alcohol dehydrogenase family)